MPSQNCEKQHSASSCLSVCRSILPTEPLGSHWTDSHEIWYLSMFREIFKKIQISLKSDKNNRYFTWWSMYIFDHISLSLLLRMRNIWNKSDRENICTIFQENFFENHAVYEIMWNNTVERVRPQMTIWRLHLHAGYLRLHTHNMQYLLLFHCNSGFTNAPRCYIYMYSSCPVNYEITWHLNLVLAESHIWSQEKRKE